MKQTNILWIFGDQHRGQALGIHGDPNVFTPNLDNLARSGVDFPRARMGSPLCCPSRGSILTSRYPHEAVPGHEYPLPDACPTVAHAFKENGYRTAWFGKWHLDGYHAADGPPALHIVPPRRRGAFDTWIGYENNNNQWDCWVHGHKEGGNEVPHHRLPGYETDSLTDLLLEFLRNAKSSTKPFFAALSLQPPHDPYIAPEAFARRHTPGAVRLRPNVPGIPAIERQAREELAGYYGMIENLDWNVGRIQATLRECGLDETTTIVFFSDHGDLHGSHGQFRKTSPLEEAIRVPFIISGGIPDHQKCWGASSALVNHVDLAPTSLGLCGLDVPSWMRGHDLSGCFRRDRPVPKRPDSAFLQIVVPTEHCNSVDRPWRGIVTDDDWKFVCLEGQPWLMFNLREDPYEQCNLAFNTIFKNERARLLERLRGWIEQTGDTFALPG